MIRENIAVDGKKLGTVMADISSGRIRIPRFQRDFVWGKQKILELLDSMYKGYPIGSIFIWSAPPKYNHLFRRIEELTQPAPTEHAGLSFVLDGQQRLLSLFVTIHGIYFDNKDYSSIAFDLQERRFVDKNNANNIRFVKICDLLHETDHLKIYNSLSDEFKLEFDRCRSILASYPLSVVTVYDQNLEGVVEVFQRINQGGKRLSRYDLVCASVWSEEFDLREHVKTDVINYFEERKFGTLTEDNVPQGIAMSLSPSGDAGADSQLKLEGELVRNNWLKFLESYRLSVSFLRDNLGVKRANFIPYEAIIPVLSSYYFFNGNKAISSVDQKDFLSEWFWRLTFSERYSATTETKMTEDSNLLKDLLHHADIPNLSNIKVSLDEVSLITSSMTRKSALRNGILCLLAQRKPLHFINGTEINVSDDNFSDYTAAEKHHIFPQAYLKRHGLEKKLHSLPNFCFIPSELNKTLSDTSPSAYFTHLRETNYDFEKVMRTHLIPVGEDSGIWSDDYDKFLQQRASLLKQEIYRLCRADFVIQPAERQPVIELIEEELRDQIDLILKQENDDYWLHLIPNDIKTTVKTRIDAELNSNPAKKPNEYVSPRRKLSFCNIMDYYKIITQKHLWRHFESIFRPQRDVEVYFRSLSDYRNAVFHGRDIDALLESRGKTALIWFSSALDISLGDITG